MAAVSAASTGARMVIPGIARIVARSETSTCVLPARPAISPVYAAPILTLAWVWATAMRTWSSARLVKKIPNELSHGT